MRLTGVYLTALLFCIALAEGGSAANESNEPNGITRITGKVVSSTAEPIKDAVVYLEPDKQTLPEKVAADSTKSNVADESPTIEVRIVKGKFEKYLLPIVVMSKLHVTWSNNEEHMLHVGSIKQAQFGALVPPDTREFKYQFKVVDELAIVDCSLHAQERMFVTVLPNTYFATSDENGDFAIHKNISPGKYLLKAIHPDYGRAVGKTLNIDGVSHYQNLQLKSKLSKPAPP
jgi:hypothetical protein